MKVIIAGSRDITDGNTVAKAYFASRFEATEIISGGARGVDTLGEQLAKELDIPVKRFPADWDQYGKSAGYRRNAEMAKYADALIAVWDMKSKGTKHMINIARKNGLKVYVYKVNQ